jgi:hypothetical protein
MKSVLISVLFVGFGCVCAFGQGLTGTTTITRDFVFPPVGLGSGETAEVDLVNIAPTPASSSATAPSCTGTVTFAGATGAVIGKAMPFTTTGGQVASVSLPFSSANITGVRGVILVSVQQSTTLPSSAPCSLVFYLETYDSTGATHVFLGNASTTTPPVLRSAQPGH